MPDIHGDLSFRNISLSISLGSATSLPALESQAPQSDEQLARRCVLDTAARSATGTFVYPAIWFTLVLATGTHDRWPLLAWLNVLGLGLLALLRMALNHRLEHLLTVRLRTTSWVFTVLTLLMAFYWGALTAWCMAHAPDETLSWVMLAATVGFCAGGNTMVGINPTLRLSYPGLMIAPVFLVEVLMPTASHLMMAALEGAFGIYLVRSSRVVHDDYWHMLQTQRLSDARARSLELASLTDGLTQIPNRPHFDRQFQYEWERQCRHGAPVSVMLVDLDHFKSINDTYGHPFGDACLQAVSQALSGSMGRSTDFVARYGGEEFVVLLAQTDGEGARVVAERLLQQVREISLSHQGAPVHITCSIGVASTVPHGSEPPAALVKRADDALYRAKHHGRNRAEMAV